MNLDKKTTGWVSYITWIGWIIAYACGDKEGAKFHLNQSLLVNIGLTIGFVFYDLFFWIPIITYLIVTLWSVFCFVCGLLGLIAAVNEEEKEIPLFGQFKLLK